MTQELPKTCAICAHSRNAAGTLYQGEDRAYCACQNVAAVVQAGAVPVPCEGQRFALSDQANGVCGIDGVFWEARQ